MQQLLELHGWGDFLCWELLSGVEPRLETDVRVYIKEKVQGVLHKLEAVAPPRGLMVCVLGFLFCEGKRKTHLFLAG